jgi:hypothetical protein
VHSHTLRSTLEEAGQEKGDDNKRNENFHPPRNEKKPNTLRGLRCVRLHLIVCEKKHSVMYVNWMKDELGWDVMKLS